MNAYYPITCLLTLGYLCIDIYVPVMRDLALYFDVSIENVKYFNTCYILGISLLIFFQSMVIDRLDKLALMKYATYAFTFISGLIFFFHFSFWEVCILRVLQGCAASVVITVSIPYFLDIYQDVNLIKKLAEINTIMTSVLLAAPFLAVSLVALQSVDSINGVVFVAALVNAAFLSKTASQAYKPSKQNKGLKVYVQLLQNKKFINYTVMYALSHALFLLYIFTASFLTPISTELGSHSAIYQTVIMLSFVAGNALLKKLVEKYDLVGLFLFSYRMLIIILGCIGLCLLLPKQLLILKLLICGYAFSFSLYTNLLVLERAKAFSSLKKNAFIYTVGIFFRFLFGTMLVLLYSFCQNALTTAQFLSIVSLAIGTLLSLNAWFYLRTGDEQYLP